MLSASIVARPVAVNPTTRIPSQQKCSPHTFLRGLKIGAASPFSGSSTVCQAALRNEHDTQVIRSQSFLKEGALDP